MKSSNPNRSHVKPTTPKVVRWLPIALLGFAPVASAQTETPMRPEGCAETRQITFETDSSTIDEGGQAIIAEVASCMRNNPKLQYFVVGDASPVGPKDFNWVLGYERAEAAVERLMMAGIPRYRLLPLSRGEQDGSLDQRVVFEAAPPVRLRNATDH